MNDDRATLRGAAVSREENPFANIALEYLLPVCYEKDEPQAAIPQLTLNTPWPKTPKEFRSKLASKLTKMPMRPFLLDEPPLDAIASSGLLSLQPDKQSQFDNWIQRVERTWKLYDVIAVPKFIRDTKDREEIIAFIVTMVRATNRKARFLKPAGSFLGTEKQWDVFSVVDFWKKRGAGPSLARDIAICQLYEGWYFDEKTEAEILGVKKPRIVAKDLCERRESLVAGYISAVDSAISSVYPKFVFLDEGLLPEKQRPTADDFSSFWV